MIVCNKIFKQLLSLCLFLVIAVSCNQQDSLVESGTPQDTVITRTTTRSINKTLHLEHGFVLDLGQEIKYPDHNTYRYIHLTRHDDHIVADSSYEYVLMSKLYPLVIPKTGDRYEILLEVYNKEKKNVVNWLFIEGDHFLQSSLLPTFIAGKFDINGDGRIEFAGFEEHTDFLVRDNVKLTTYNPILYYALTENGLVLDSALTRERNLKIYGEFLGFTHDINIEVPAASLKKLDTEIQTINSLANKKPH